MASPSVTYTFSNSTTADATQVNQNFTDLINSLTDGTKSLAIDALTCGGTLTANGSVILGDSASDDLTVNASLASHLAIKTNATYNIGASTLGVLSLYIGQGARTARLLAPTLSASYTLTLPDGMGTTGQFLKSDGTNASAWRYIEKTVSKTTTYTATGDESTILCDASSAAFTVTLPAAASYAGKHYYIVKTDSDITKPVTIDGNASETINGATTTTLNTQYEAIKIVCDGSNWIILERRFPTTSTAYTPTVNWASTTNKAGYWVRRGSWARVHFGFTCNGGSAGTLTISLPVTVDTAQIPSFAALTTNPIVLGTGAGYNAANTAYSGYLVRYVSTTTVTLSYWVTSGGNVTMQLADATGAAAFPSGTSVGAGNGDQFYGYCDVPVSGWNG